MICDLQINQLRESENFGNFSEMSPLFKKQKIQSQCLSPQTQQKTRQNSKIQFSDLTFTPPKKYKIDPFQNYYTTLKPYYRDDLVANEDYQRVMKEYQEIENEIELNKPINKPTLTRFFSQQKLKEVEKDNPNVLLLSSKQIPDKIVQKIDKMVNYKIQFFTPEVIIQLEREKNKDVELNAFQIWEVKKKIEKDLRKKLQKEALKLIEIERQIESQKQFETQLEKNNKLNQWHQQKKEQAKLKSQKEQLKQIMKQEQQQIKEEKNKEQFKKWLINHCEKLKRERIKRNQEIQSKNEEIQKYQKYQQTKSKMSQEEFKKWKAKKDKEQKQRNQKQNFYQTINYKEYMEYKSYVDTDTQQNEENDNFLRSPMYSDIQTTNKKSQKSSTKEKRKVLKKKSKSKKFVVSSGKVKQRIQFEKISERKSSCEHSTDFQRNYQEVTNTQKKQNTQQFYYVENKHAEETVEGRIIKQD